MSHSSLMLCGCNPVSAPFVKTGLLLTGSPVLQGVTGAWCRHSDDIVDNWGCSCTLDVLLLYLTAGALQLQWQMWSCLQGIHLPHLLLPQLRPQILKDYIAVSRWFELAQELCICLLHMQFCLLSVEVLHPNLQDIVRCIKADCTC